MLLTMIRYSLKSKVMKGSLGRKNCISLDGDEVDNDWFFVPTGLCIIKDISGMWFNLQLLYITQERFSWILSTDPWIVRISSSYNRYYFFNVDTNASRFDVPLDDIADFRWFNYNNRAIIQIEIEIIHNELYDLILTWL